MILSDKWYNALKWIVTLCIPAIATFVSSVGTAVNWEYTGITMTVLMAVATMIGTMIGISASNYNKTK